MGNSEPTGICQNCKAENFASRRVCWRCRQTLPAAFALDAQLRAASLRRTNALVAPRPAQAEIDAALSQAQIIDAGIDNNSEPEPQVHLGRRLVWLLGIHRNRA
jgi:hypothetical protein